MTHAQRARRIKEAGQVARYKTEEYLQDLSKPGISGAGGSWLFPDMLIWFYACENETLLSDLNDRMAATVRQWCADHIQELGGQFAQRDKDGQSLMVDRGDGAGLVPLEKSS